MSDDKPLYRAVIEEVCSFGPRVAGSDAERQAADAVRARLAGYGLAHVGTEPFRFASTFAWVHFLHYGLACLASVLSLSHPLLASGLIALVILSYWGEGSTRYHLLRHLCPKVQSQNVLGRIHASEEPRYHLILSGHLDSARSSPLFHPKVVDKLSGGANPLPCLTIPFVALLGLGLCILRQAWMPEPPEGLEGMGLIQGFLTFFTGAGALLMAHMGFTGRGVEGASDDASGVGSILQLCEKLSKNPLKHGEVWVLASGAEEPHLGGMHAFLKTYGALFRKDNAYFMAYDGLGCCERLVYGQEEGYITYQPASFTLLHLAQREARRLGMTQVVPVSIPAASDNLVPSSRGFQTLTWISLNERGVPPNYHWHTDTVANLDTRSIEGAIRLSESMIASLDREWSES